MWRVLAAWQRGGVGAAIHTLSSRIADALLERRHRRHTGGLVPIETLIEDWRGCHDYFPTTYGELRAVLASLAPNPDDVFVDIGCGKGRAMLIAAALPLRAVVGIDVSPGLCAEARSNIGRARPSLACRDIRVIEADGADWPVPTYATLIYLYNPFHGERLTRFFDAVLASWQRAPRVIRIVYNNPSHFEPLEANYPWLRRYAEHWLEYRWIVYQTVSPGIADEKPF